MEEEEEEEEEEVEVGEVVLVRLLWVEDEEGEL